MLVQSRRICKIGVRKDIYINTWRGCTCYFPGDFDSRYTVTTAVLFTRTVELWLLERRHEARNMHGRKKSDLPQTKEEKDAIQEKISNYKKVLKI